MKDLIKYLISIEQMTIDVANSGTESLISEDLKKSLNADIDTDRSVFFRCCPYMITLSRDWVRQVHLVVRRGLRLLVVVLVPPLNAAAIGISQCKLIGLSRVSSSSTRRLTGGGTFTL